MDLQLNGDSFRDEQKTKPRFMSIINYDEDDGFLVDRVIFVFVEPIQRDSYRTKR